MKLTTADRVAIRSVVEQQLQAFQRDDAVGAFTFASPEIQNQFQTPEQFISMVKTTYHAVYNPRSVLFEDLIEIDTSPAQEVLLLDSHGELIKAVYLMQQQPNLSWRIHGCFLVPMDAQLD